MLRKPNGLISAVNPRGRGILARPAPKLSDILTQKRYFYTFSEDTNRRVYRNRRGEEIVFTPCYPPPGYIFVPSGNVFITRRCRKLAQKVYAVYRPKSRKRRATQIGLHVPKDASEKARSEREAERARTGERLWRYLDKNYPKMPPADRNELHCLVLSQTNNVSATSVLRDIENTIYGYVLNQYTRFNFIPISGKRRHTKAIDRARRKAQEILASWRDENGEKRAEKEKERK